MQKQIIISSKKNKLPGLSFWSFYFFTIVFLFSYLSYPKCEKDHAQCKEKPKTEQASVKKVEKVKSSKEKKKSISKDNKLAPVPLGPISNIL